MIVAVVAVYLVMVAAGRSGGGGRHDAFSLVLIL